VPAGAVPVAGGKDGDGVSEHDVDPMAFIDFMDGAWITHADAARSLGVSRERLRQLAEEAKVPALLTPYGRLFRTTDIEARRATVEEQRGKWLKQRKVCRGRHGPHAMTPDNTIAVKGGNGFVAMACKACRYATIREWQAAHPGWWKKSRQEQPA
jgi:hypothetical protein